MKPIDTI